MVIFAQFFHAENLHYPGVTEARMQQISSEICALLEEQSKLPNSGAKLTEMAKRN
jgi:hypothetical protein